MSILEFLSVCVEAQPGLIEMFLNVQLTDSSSSEAARKVCIKACHRNSTETTYICIPRLSDYSGECNITGIFLFCQDLSIGKISCLQTVLNLMEADKQVGLFFIKIIQLK